MRENDTQNHGHPKRHLVLEIQIHPGGDQRLHRLLVTVPSRRSKGRVSILPAQRERDRERMRERKQEIDG